jgi:hypothetical protein
MLRFLLSAAKPFDLQEPDQAGVLVEELAR